MKLNLWIHEDEPEDLLVNGEILLELKPTDFPGGLKVGDFLEIIQTEPKGTSSLSNLLPSNAASSTSSSSSSASGSNLNNSAATSATGSLNLNHNNANPTNPNANNANAGSSNPNAPNSNSAAAGSKSGNIALTAVLQVGSLSKLSKNQRSQISVSKAVADLFGFTRRDCNVRKIQPENIEIEFMQIAFKDQYIGRSDMWRMKKSVIGKGVYLGKKLEFAGVRGQIKELYMTNKVQYGVVTENTKAIFRSESAKFFIFFQMSREMWEFDEDGDLFFEKALLGFLPELFSNWSLIGVNHLVSIVLFTRVYFEDLSASDLASHPSICLDHRGKYYQDFYKVVVDKEIRSDWKTVIPMLKNEFTLFRQSIFLQQEISALNGQISSASEGNFLEANNLALNVFDKHFTDRDLNRTGLSVIVVSPGSGMFDIDPDLFKLTKKRMIDNGIGCDVVCLGRPPLHTVPLFKFSSERENPEAAQHFNLPHWVDISFFNRSKPSRERPYKIPRFTPRCKMYDIQMGATELDGTPVLELRSDDEDLSLNDYGEPDDSGRYAAYDKTLFGGSASTPLTVSKQKAKPKKVPGLDIEALSLPPDDLDKIERKLTSSSGGKKKAPLPSSVSRMSERGRAKPSFSKDDDRYGVSLAESIDAIVDEVNGKSYQEEAADRRGIPISQAVNINDRRASYAQPSMATSYEEDTASSFEDDGVIGAADKPESKVTLSSSPMPITAWSIDLTTNRKATPVRYKKSVKAPINPSNPSKNIIRLSAYRRRWIHAFPESFSSNSGQTELQGIKWKSLCTPACLPLTTDYFPPPDELEANYQESVSILSLSEDSLYYRTSDLLFLELVSQRLAQGYQIIVKPQTQTPTDASQPYFLSIGNNFNKVIHLPNNNIEIKRYFRKAKDPKPAISYRCSLWGKYDDKFDLRTVVFSHADVTKFNWSSQDNLICGHDEEVDMNDSQKYWRARFVLIPIKPLPKGMKVLNLPANEELSEEEKRIAGFYKFTEVFEKARRKADDQPLKIQVTTLRPSAIMTTDGERESHYDKKKSKKYAKDASFQVLAQGMQDPDIGVPMKDRRWHLRMYRRCMVGSEMVTWLEAFVKGVESREEAVIFGNELMERGLFEHVINTHKFLDGHFFYHLKDEFIAQAKPEEFSKRWFKPVRSLTPSSGSQSSSHESLQSQSAAKINKRVEFSRAMVIEPDGSKKSDRPEWALLHYDTIFNPTIAYHIHVHWLVATGQLIDELVQSWSRRAAQCGLLLVEAPARQSSVSHSDSSFLSLCKIPLSVSPPPLTDMHFRNSFDEIPATFFEEEILLKFDFVLDFESDLAIGSLNNVRFSYSRGIANYTQFIHRSGCVMIQILPNGQGFLWEDNRLYTRRFPNHTNDPLRNEFTNFCRDPEGLAAFYKEVEEVKLKSVDLSDDSDDEEKRLRSTSLRKPGGEDGQKIHKASALQIPVSRNPEPEVSSPSSPKLPKPKTPVSLKESPAALPATSAVTTSKPPTPVTPSTPVATEDPVAPTPQEPVENAPAAAEPPTEQSHDNPYGQEVQPNTSVVDYYLQMRGAVIDPTKYQ